MKIERQISPPRLYEWALNFSMPGLVIKRIREGYGCGYYVYAAAHVPWIGRGDPVAALDDDTISLFQTNYFSDMQLLGMAYEKATGHEITLRYWQSPKDEPL